VRADPDGVFVDHILVGFSMALLVINIPTKRFEQWIEELAPKLGFVVLAGVISFAISVEAFNQIENDLGHGYVGMR